MNNFLKSIQFASFILMGSAVLQTVSLTIQIFDYYSSVAFVEARGLMVQRVFLGEGPRFIDIIGDFISLAVGVFIFIVHRKLISQTHSEMGTEKL